jgi:hypothetical protein
MTRNRLPNRRRSETKENAPFGLHYSDGHKQMELRL